MEIRDNLITAKPARVVQKLTTKDVSQVGISSITLSELEYGVSKSGRPEQNKFALVEFLSSMEILDYNDLAAQEYGDIRSYLERQGTPIGSLDTHIAAHARSLDCVLVTNNEREFLRVPSKSKIGPSKYSLLHQA